MKVILEKFIQKTAKWTVNYCATYSTKCISVIDVPFSKGQPKSGVEKGPEAIRSTNVIQELKETGFSICHTSLSESSLIHLGQCNVDDNVTKDAKNISSVAQMAKVLCHQVEKDVMSSEKTIVLGGDHSIALGSIAGHSRAKGDICVIWIDAHAGEFLLLKQVINQVTQTFIVILFPLLYFCYSIHIDINTISSSESGNMHGMPVSFLLHQLKDKRINNNYFNWLMPCISTGNFAYIGLRDVDKAEDELLLLLRPAITLFTSSLVRQLGPKEVINRVISRINPNLDKLIHVSFDIDSLDPSLAPSTGTPVDDGLTLEDVEIIGSIIQETKKLSVFDLVEVNPAIGTKDEVEKTKNSAKQVIRSFFI